MVSVRDVAEQVVANVENVIEGKRDEIELALIALLCQGHVLIEDVPGVGKTVLAKALARSVGCSFRRIQFTPDLLPSDITGISIYNQKSLEFEYRPGPIVAQVVLADEINRATPKTQSAMLECMEERQITVDGVTYRLPTPFMVLATQNPIEYEGTFPLPEAQLDRFFLKTALGYPDADDERRILTEQRTGHPLRLLEPVLTVEEVQQLKRAAQDVYVDELIQRWVVELVRATRENEFVAIGASVRGSLALERAARGWALLNDRSFVVPDDVERLFSPVLMHRIVFRPAFLAEARRNGWDAASAGFKEACLSAAPKPEADPDGEVFALGPRPSA